jgi:hypothetical protein
MKKLLLYALVYISIIPCLSAQNRQSLVLKDMVFKIDTLAYYWSVNTILYQDSRHLYFEYYTPSPICEINLYLTHPERLSHIYLSPSPDYEVVDSLKKINEDYFQCKVRFRNLDQTDFLALNFTDEAQKNFLQVKLLPFTEVKAKLMLKDEELYVGEERVAEIDVNKPSLVRADNQWAENEGINYKISERDNKIFLHTFTNNDEVQDLQVQLYSKKPFLKNGKLTFQMPPIRVNFSVKKSRLAFLKVDEKDITLEENLRTGIEVLIEHHHRLQIKKTYRIENQEEEGGYLIGELFTKSKLSNNKVLAILRLYALHSTSEGYLYLKDGDKAQFLTNFDITPQMRIDKVSLLKDGGEWTNDLSVYAGENVEIKIEGESLRKGNFKLEGLVMDSVMKTDKSISFKTKIPLHINKKKILIYDNQQAIPQSLTVKEYQKPHALDFVDIDFGTGHLNVADLNQPILHYSTIRGLIFSFRPELIDAENKPFGKQIISIEVKITGANRQLIELVNIPRVVICPAENSPRFAAYDKKDCHVNDISLNNYISRKTHELEDWSRIELTIKHKADEHGGNGFSQKVEIILARHTNFDIDVSFPAGLITKKIGNPDFTSLGGISIAAIAQFKFYRPNKIAQLRPYRIGIGTIALDAFNLSDNNTNRDLGIVAIGSIYPSKRDTKLSFPLFLGFGYLIKQEQWFYLLGPGIRVNL